MPHKYNILKTLKRQVWRIINGKFGVKIMVSLAKPMAKKIAYYYHLFFLILKKKDRLVLLI